LYYGKINGKCIKNEVRLKNIISTEKFRYNNFNEGGYGSLPRFNAVPYQAVRL